MFIDEAKITVEGGKGGNGCLSFRREKFVPRGGPDGGDGGHGGSVVFVAVVELNTLQNFRFNPLLRADCGKHGSGANKTGRSAQDREVRVPAGTLVLDEERVLLLADLAKPGDRFTAASGGRGGKGNARFASSTNRAPTRHDPGFEGEKRILNLELKLLADVGLIGFPNAGKSTLISRVSAARPKIADYPFTTLIPNLGVVDRGDYSSFVMADIPGLIEGAHEGAGLGHQFLRHVERCKVLLHLVDPTAPERDPLEDIQAINRELKRHSAVLAEKPQILVLTKSDALQDQTIVDTVKAWAENTDTLLLVISSVSGDGLKRLVQATGDALDRLSDENEKG
ncbi:MAG: GTPase ObgE [Acidobacteria bacterium]|uniref:GTPase Obg n=1 Tax=Candidatus Polarisedimenticola svalbardensis TaxID=2886004 RepID=A0A8J7CDZ4_9BACT|nr:GTPase ObgE [Candidatus Polarisedimenticola svalbardensis]